jgi:hypothetical protein
MYHSLLDMLQKVGTKNAFKLKRAKKFLQLLLFSSKMHCSSFMSPMSTKVIPSLQHFSWAIVQLAYLRAKIILIIGDSC